MKTVRQLSTIFLPTHYSLSLDLHQARERMFRGVVDISGVLTPGQSTVALHSKDLTIESVLIDGKAATFHLDEFDELHITHPDLVPGKHIITAVFSGAITDAMHGLYPCNFQHEGTDKQLFATQFESHHAREVFPCIDEPAAKATYDMTLTTTPGITVLGNMPIRQQRIENDKLVTVFDRSPRMSSYLLAFVVGELHKKTAVTKRGIEVNIWATPAQPPETLDFALDIATRSIDFFEGYFGVDYPLPKSDHVALPDFSSGAMENWGLITYRESCLLADPANTPISSKRFIATVIAHELSHQWFGNLVTMQWWNDLWLNESFANFMEYVAIDALEPEWRMWEDFATNEVTAALRRDSLDGVQSVKTDVNHPDEISALFDGAIVYAKGGRLLRMARELIGDTAFREGLKAYFEQFAYQNTIGNDLWQALETASGQPILQLMNRWISQPGLPLVRVQQTGDETIIHQQRFFVGEHADDETLWPIPLFANQPTIDGILSERRKSFPAQSDVLLNQNLSAHFVTQYDAAGYQSLLAKVADNTLPTLDKICLLQDTMLLTRAGVTSSAELLPLARAFQNEQNEKVYSMAMMALGELRKFTESNPELKRRLKAISRDIAAPVHAALGWDAVAGETDDDIERRSTALGLMLYGEDDATLTEAKRRFDLGFEEVSPEIRASVLSATVRHFETPEMIDRLFGCYTSTTSTDLKLDIALGLTGTKSPDTIQRILGSLQDAKIIRPQDASRWFIYLIRNSDARQTTWKWLKSNWSWVKDTFGGDKSYDEFVRYAANALITRHELDEYTAFFTPMLNQPALTRTIDMGIREIAGRVELIERDMNEVEQVLLNT